MNTPSEERSSVRHASPEMNALLGKKLSVLDDGFVRLIDYMGTDEAIVQAARVSYGKGTKKVSEDRGLIRYLLRNRHSTPFEMCELKLHVRVPMDCWRQWIRHRTANVNEYSTRYSVAIDATQKTSPEAWRKQAAAADNKQGSAGFFDIDMGCQLSEEEAAFHDQARLIYNKRLALSVAREQARKDLPLATYTEAYWKIDLHNLLHFLALRMDAHAQSEIRAYATVIGDSIVRHWCPLAWEAFQDYRCNTLSLTGIDLEIVTVLQRDGCEAARQRANELGLLRPAKQGGYKRNRERSELEKKLERLGLARPW